MDEGGKATDQKLFEALIVICPHFDRLRSSRGLVDVARSGRNPGPEKDAPHGPSYMNRPQEKVNDGPQADDSFRER
jgi:hypothetical protein